MLINIKSEPWAWQLTNCSRGIHNAWRFGFELALVFTAQWFNLGGSVVHPLTGRYVYGECYTHRMNYPKSGKPLFAMYATAPVAAVATVTTFARSPRTSLTF
ncbi:hypothetical protein CGI66_23745 [Vibrio parahaemolyticus]|nr:hypothetical protein CGI66_23745 [Vibrio parahaemolyticus]